MRRLSLLAFALLAACATHYEKPALEVPEQWKEAAPRFAEDGRWWRIYNDQDLDKVVDEGLKSNADLLIAIARVDEAKALLDDAYGSRYPVVAAGANAYRQEISQRTATSFPGIPHIYNDYRAALNVSWEIDLFGRLRANVEAAKADLQANEASREGVRLTLAANIAKSYFALRSLDEQVDLTRRTVQLRDEALALQRKRFTGGLISEFELRQLEAETAAVRAQLPPLERDRESQEAALAALLGRSPKLIFDGGVTRALAFNEAPGAAVIPSGMPSELLLRRPDIVQAERQLVAVNARIDAARANMFPSIQLTGFYGRESRALGTLFTGGPAGVWQVAGGLTQPLFAGGRLKAQTEIAEARARQAVAGYQKTVQTAFSEVRAALAAQARSRESYDAESMRADALAQSLRLARLRYANGVASQLDVIDAERGLLAAQVARIEALRAQRAAVADLFRALGG